MTDHMTHAEIIAHYTARKEDNEQRLHIAQQGNRSNPITRRNIHRYERGIDQCTAALNALTAPRSITTMLPHIRTYRNALTAAYEHVYSHDQPQWKEVHRIEKYLQQTYSYTTFNRIQRIAIDFS